MAIPTPQLCKACGQEGSGNYCSHCGQKFIHSRITLHSLLHDVFHLFTHLDKGFGYTLKELLVRPGSMQRMYIEGDRHRHQKPFSMFFICATVAALSRYWIYLVLLKYYGADSASEAQYFHEYMVLLHIAIMPFYALVVYLFFIDYGYNYAETGVMILYVSAVFFVAATLIALLRFIWPEMDTAYVEFPLLVIYNAITLLNFYPAQAKWKVLLKSFLIIGILFGGIQLIEDFIVRQFD